MKQKTSIKSISGVKAVQKNRSEKVADIKNSNLMDKILIAEERARFEEAHARIAEAKLRKLKANVELKQISKDND